MMIEEEIIEQRYNICKNCEFNFHGVCKKCACIIKLKVKFADSECPMKFWGKQEQKK